MKLLVLADIDDLHWGYGTGQGDVFVSCGDVDDAVILEAAQAFGCAKILAVKGNHDKDTDFPSPITDLHLQIRQHCGLTFGGFNGSWKYKPRGHYLYEQDEVKRLLGHFPPVDVFISHNTARGIHDRDDDVHIGFDALNDYISRARPRLLLHGHQHVNMETMVDSTMVIGVCGHRVCEIAV